MFNLNVNKKTWTLSAVVCWFSQEYGLVNSFNYLFYTFGGIMLPLLFIYIYIFFISLSFTKDFLNRVTQTWDEQYNKEDNN